MDPLGEFGPGGWSPRSDDDPDPGWWGAALTFGVLVFALLVGVALRYSPWW
jgi:hypothetical protein